MKNRGEISRWVRWKRETVNRRRVEYDTYRLSIGQWGLSCMIGMSAAAVLILIFYRNAWMILAGTLAGGILAPRIQKRRLIEKRKTQLREEFKEALHSLILTLRAGRSLEGAFQAALEDMDAALMPLIYKEWKDIAGQLQLGFSIEESLLDFGERSGIEEIQSFARTIQVCKRSEGDVVRVMENTIHLLQERMEIQMELQVLLAKKKTEQKILSIMPFLVIGLLLLMSPDYLEPLYSSLQGQLIMTVCVILIGISFLLSRKMARIVL